jgi:SAM-dependent methyltransferase
MEPGGGWRLTVAGVQHNGFEDVDRAPDPHRFVAAMDAAHADAQIVAQKCGWMNLLAVRPGESVLDLGCGTGADARLLASQAVPGGCVVGIDASLTMLTAARERADEAAAPLRFVAGSAFVLPLREGAFDACWSDRVFQHLADPAGALAELVRVTRPGGRIAVGGPDFGTQVLDLPDRATTRAVLDFRCDRLRRQGWSGRQLPRLFDAAGLVEISVRPATVAIWGSAPAQLTRNWRTSPVARRPRASSRPARPSPGSTRCTTALRPAPGSPRIPRSPYWGASRAAEGHRSTPPARLPSRTCRRNRSPVQAAPAGAGTGTQRSLVYGSRSSRMSSTNGAMRSPAPCRRARESKSRTQAEASISRRGRSLRTVRVRDASVSAFASVAAPPIRALQSLTALTVLGGLPAGALSA